MVRNIDFASHQTIKANYFQLSTRFIS